MKKDNRQLVLKAYPKCISAMALLFLAIFWWAALTTNQTIETSSYLIFNGVALLVIGIQKSRIAKFDKQTKTVCLINYSILGKQEQWFPLVDIDAVEMNYGRGQFARGGRVNLIINKQLHAIVDSDICWGNRERNVRLKDAVAEWL